MKYNLTRYRVGDRIIVGQQDSRTGYPHAEVKILEKAPTMGKVQTLDNSFWEQGQQRWLSTEEWFVITKISPTGKQDRGNQDDR